MHYAVATTADGERRIYGKGDDPAAAEADARRALGDDEEHTALRGTLTALSREEAEQTGLVARGAVVTWYAHLGHYRVEEQPQKGIQEMRGIS